jgi:uncharacterized membrane protein YdbT with pleckstrin-like domain
MSYLHDNLLRDETVIHQSYRHWSTFLTWRGLFTLFLAPLIDRKTSEFAVTNRRVVIKVGLLSRTTVDLNLSKVESVDVVQGFWARMLGYGTIVVVGTGGSREQFDHLTDPLGFRRAVQQASVDLMAGPQTTEPAQPNDDPVARLEQAKAMHDKGLISDAEFEDVKKRVLTGL